MAPQDFYEFSVTLLRDEETGEVVAEVPALSIADYGPDSEKAVRRLGQMVSFHLECLRTEGKPIPQDTAGGEGLYLRVKRPAGVP